MPRLERRRRPRAIVDQTAVVRQGGRTLPAKLVDISESGVRFATSGRIKEDEELQLHFRFPWSNDPLVLDATLVRQVRTQGRITFAARFERVQPNTKLMLTLGVSKILTKAKAPAEPAPRPKKRKAPERRTSSISRVLNRLGL